MILEDATAVAHARVRSYTCRCNGHPPTERGKGGKGTERQGRRGGYLGPREMLGLKTFWEKQPVPSNVSSPAPLRGGLQVTGVARPSHYRRRVHWIQVVAILTAVATVAVTRGVPRAVGAAGLPDFGVPPKAAGDLRLHRPTDTVDSVLDGDVESSAVEAHHVFSAPPGGDVAVSLSVHSGEAAVSAWLCAREIREASVPADPEQGRCTRVPEDSAAVVSSNNTTSHAVAHLPCVSLPAPLCLSLLRRLRSPYVTDGLCRAQGDAVAVLRCVSPPAGRTRCRRPVDSVLRELVLARPPPDARSDGCQRNPPCVRDSRHCHRREWGISVLLLQHQVSRAASPARVRVSVSRACAHMCVWLMCACAVCFSTYEVLLSITAVNASVVTVYATVNGTVPANSSNYDYVTTAAAGTGEILISTYDSAVYRKCVRLAYPLVSHPVAASAVCRAGADFTTTSERTAPSM